MKAIKELGLDLENVEVRKRVLDFLKGSDVEFKYTNLNPIDCRGKIIGYRSRMGERDFSLLLLAVGDNFPFGWRDLGEFETVIWGVDSETKKVLIHISDIQMPNILADALVMFVKGKTISGSEVSNDWKVSKSYLSNSNGFKY